MPAIGTIATATDGLLLDVPDSKFVAHEHIQIYPANSPVSLNQTWTIVSDRDGVPVPPGFVNIFAGDESSKHLCIDVPNSSTKSGILVQLYPANGPGGSTNQQWKLIAVEDDLVYIASALDENLVLDVRGGSGVAHALVRIYDRGDNQPNQLWSIAPLS